MNMNYDKISRLMDDVDDFTRSIKSGYKAACKRAERAKREVDVEEYGDALTLVLEYEAILTAMNRYNLKDSVIDRFNDCIERKEEK